MRLLIVSHDFPPEIAGVRRVLKFCEYLPEHGITPTVLTTTPFAATGYDPAPLRGLAERGVEVIRVVSPGAFHRRHRLPIHWAPDDPPPARFAAGRSRARRQRPAAVRWLARQLRRWASFPDDRAGWVGRAVRAAERWLRDNPGAAVMTTSFPHSTHLIGLRLAERTPGLRWIADFRDGWTQNADFFDPPTERHAQRHRDAERAVARRADLVFAASAPIAAHLERVGGRAPGTTATILNGFDEEEIAAARERAAAAHAARGAGDPLRLVYTGTLFGRRSAESLLRALAAVRRGAIAPSIRLTLYSRLTGADDALLRSLGLAEIVDVAGMVPHADALAAQAAADLLVLVIEDGPAAAIMMTQKVFEYLGSGRPIFGLMPACACRTLLEEVGGCYLAEPGDIDAAAATLRRALDDIAGGASQLPPREKIAHLTRRAQIARAAERIKALERTPGAP